jgi:hypothetical protein
LPTTKSVYVPLLLSEDRGPNVRFSGLDILGLSLEVEVEEGIISFAVEETFTEALKFVFIVSEEFVRVFISWEVNSGIASSKRMSLYSIRDWTILSSKNRSSKMQSKIRMTVVNFVLEMNYLVTRLIARVL